VAHELLAAGSFAIATGDGLVGFAVLFAPATLCGANVVAPACMAEFERTGKVMGAGDVTAVGLLGRLLSRKILGNLTLGNPRATKPGSAGVVSTSVMRVEVVGSRLKGSRTGR
jgi:hypothetical protein